MIDLFNKPDPTGAPTPTAAPATPALPTFTAPSAASVGDAEAENEARGHNWVWDKVGRAVFGDANNPEDRGLLGGIPVVGDVARAPGIAAQGLMDAGGFGISNAVVKPISTALGHLPSVTHLSDNYGLGDPKNVGISTINAVDPKYAVVNKADPISVGNAGAQLVTDLNQHHGQNDMATQFLILGQWQKENDPEAFAQWEKTLSDAQGDEGAAGEMLSRYIQSWSTAYMDTTPEGVTGWLGTHPELAFAGSGSLGQGLTDDLGRLMTAQQHAEKGAATVSGAQEGFLAGTRVAPDGNSYGSRLNQLLALADNDPKKLTPVEAAAVAGVKEQGWTMNHAYDFLVAHGQGYSSNAAVELGLGLALDPFAVGGSGAGLAASVGEKAALYGAEAGARGAFAATRSAVAGARLADTYTGVAKMIGTTVEATRANPILGPAFKVARTVVDPLSGLPAGTRGAAKVDVFASAGLKGSEKGFGDAAVSDMFARSDAWGVREMADRAFGTTAMNFSRKWALAQHIQTLAGFGEATARRFVGEDLIQEIGRNAPKDAVSRIADYVYKKREFYMTPEGEKQLADRIVTVTGKTNAEVTQAVATMSRDEKALWHAMSYTEAFRDYTTAARGAAPEEWGGLAKQVDDIVPLNPHELDNEAAKVLHADISKMKPSAAIKAWNEAAGKYTLIENLGRVTTGGRAQLSRRLAALDRIMQDGGLHTALEEREMNALPAAVKRDFLGKWVGADGKPMWRLGFKPKNLQASGLVYDDTGKLLARYEPSIENVTDAIPMAQGGIRQVTDPLGRLVPDAVKDSGAAKAAGRLGDSLEVAINVARDRVSSERVMTSMEQSFRRQMRAAGYGDKVAGRVFKLARDYAQENTFTLAGMSPDDFWKATKDELGDIVDKRVGKSDIFAMLAKSAGGDLRLLGLTSGMTQRIRAGLIARGLDPNNYLGAITVKAYNSLRYALNPTFFLQAEFDAPWFNMYRGVMFDLRGATPKPGSALYEMQGITEAIGHSSMARDLSMDYTERAATIGWQREVSDRLKDIPNFEPKLGERIKGRLGRMVMNNELLYINSKTGEIVLDAIDTTKKALLRKADEAEALGNAEEAQMWRDQGMDIDRVFESMRQEMSGTLGRLPTNDELGRRYLSEMIDDSQMEVRSKEGLLNYQAVAQKGAYHVPTDIGELKPLQLDYGAESLGLPNIHSAKDLRTALGKDTVTIGDVRDIMKQLGYHPDHIQRFVNGLNFNWRTYFDGLRKDLGMTRFEMQGIEDLMTKDAKALGISNHDYMSQVLPMTATAARKASDLAPYEVVTDVAKGVEEVRNVAADYMRSIGRSTPERRYVQISPDYGRRTAEAYDALPPAGPVTAGEPVTAEVLDAADTTLKPGGSKSVRRAYQAFVDETKAQYDFIKSRGVKIEPTMSDPYENSAAMMEDVRVNGRLKVFAGSAEHPLMTDAQNVMFRGVHDYFAHAAEGFQFGARGEANAAIKHSQMYSEEAQKAMLTETHGQNSFVNFSERSAMEGRGGVATAAGERPKTVAEVNKANVAPGRLADMTTDPGYLYHATTKEALPGISTEGLQPRPPTGDGKGLGTPLEHPGEWLDRGTDPRLYLGDRNNLVNLYGADSDRVVVRVKARKLQSEPYGGDSYMTSSIPAKQVEVFGADGAWHPVADVAAPADTRTVAEVNKAKPGSIYAEQKAGILPKDILDEFKGKYVGDPAVDPMAGVSEHAKTVLDLMRASGMDAGPERIDALTKVVVNNLHPSMKRTLLDYFENNITAPGGLRDQALAAGDTEGAASLEQVLADLRGGWGTAADDQFRDMVIRRASGMEEPLATPAFEPATGLSPQPFIDEFGWTQARAQELVDKAELMPTDRLKPLREIDRRARPETEFHGSLDDLKAHIEATGGIEKQPPIIVWHDAKTGATLVSDGNHRLTLAIEEGWDRVPVVVETRPTSEVGLAEHSVKVTPKGPVPDEGIMRPSEFFDSPPAGPIAEPEVERAARFFSQYVQTFDPSLLAGDVMKNVVNNIPVEGASPHNFTQGLLMNTLGENFRLAERDAIRLAHMNTDRTVLDRSLNHPFFGMYPSSYFWGKVIPETFKFIAAEPFGMKTSLGLQGYLHVKQSIGLQSQYDPRMKDLWDKVGKSAVLGLASYLSPSMPWEDMRANLPPWVRSLSKGEDFQTLLEKEIDTFSPQRWVNHFTDAGAEVGGGVSGAVNSMTPQDANALEQISSEPAGVATPSSAPVIEGPIQGANLGPVLQNELKDLQDVLSK